jgi:hypothetical protein
MINYKLNRVSISYRCIQDKTYCYIERIKSKENNSRGVINGRQYLFNKESGERNRVTAINLNREKVMHINNA